MPNTLHATQEVHALRASSERKASTGSGYVMLLIMALIAIGMFLSLGAGSIVAAATMAVGGIALLFILCGFYFLQPNQAAAILLFGDYKGTDRTTGLRWVLPWLTRSKISTRIHNITSDKLKVNDLRGNPIEIAANVVWRVADTAQALYDVDSYMDFVHIQIESAVRTIAGKYPYDDIEHKEVTLRADAEIVGEDLEKELQDRVKRAGIVIDEARIMHLAYAQEIAQAMLRRQQAEAVIAARARLVEGAVTMVETALEQLSAKGVVHLDDERKAAMVSNLMVVLCAERDTQPVVNAGSLYQ